MSETLRGHKQPEKEQYLMSICLRDCNWNVPLQGPLPRKS